MHWLIDLFTATHGVAHTVLILALVAASGLALGTLRIFGISLGVAGVLFTGLAFGHFGMKIEGEVMEFVREFGLILFVYTIGIQVGPGFFASLRRQGLPLNLMAASIVVLGAIIALVLCFIFPTVFPLPTAVGAFSGATTNTPSLGASQQALAQLLVNNPQKDQLIKLPGLAYAVAYPFGIIGIILNMLLIRSIFKISLTQEQAMIVQLQQQSSQKLLTRNLEVKNPNLDGVQLDQVPTLGSSGAVVSRILKGGKPQMANPDTVLHMGDVLLAVGPQPALDGLELIIGKETHVDVRTLPSNIVSRRILVTRSMALGKSIHDLEIRSRFGVTVTRVSRAEIELPITPGTRLQFGDNLIVVGEEAAIRQVSKELGDSPKKLSHPQVIPIFVGIALGVILGSLPLKFEGMPAPVKLGLAGGPLLVAILLSWLGNVGPLVWYMPISANFVLRELGITLFLAAVGLRAGDQFVSTLVNGNGLYWVLFAAIITFVPLMVVGLFARMVMKLNYMTICGLLSGSMTDPPALAFAGQMTHSDAPSISYATVYPLVMFLRVVLAQAMVLFFFRG